MVQLLVRLRLPAASDASFAYVLSPDGQAVDRHAHAEAALLPFQDADETVALVPAQALSWHRVQLPKGSAANPARLRTVLEGLLEERVLDDMAELHCALQPDAAKASGPVWVAICHAGWLREQLNELEAAGCVAGRIVPEFAPQPFRAAPVVTTEPGMEAPPLPEDARIHAIADEDGSAWWVRTGSDLEAGEEAPGVLLWPLPDPALADLNQAEPPEAVRRVAQHAPKAVLADAAIAQWAEQSLRQPVTVQHTAQRWLHAAGTPWNLAQMAFANRQSDRVRKQALQLWQRFLHAPQWQAVRWGLAGLVLVQLIGLNWAVLQERRMLADNKQAIAKVLTDTFTHVKLVVDPPTQMQRELAALRQGSGALAATEVEGMLALVSRALPDAQVQALQWDGTQLRMKGITLSTEQQGSLQATLRPSRLALSQDGNDWLIRLAP